MKIETKIFWTLLSMSLLLGLMGVLAVNRQRAVATMGATKEAENVARIVSVLLTSEPDKPSVKAVQEIVARLHQSERRDVVLLDANKLTIADAVPEEIGTTFDHDANNEVGATIRDRKVRTFIEVSPAHPKGIKQIVVPVEGESGEVIGALVLEYTPLYQELMRLTRTTTYHVVVAALGSILIALLIAWYMGRSISKPLCQLTEAAVGFAAGRTDLPMPPPGKDEVGALAKAFNHMREKRRQTEGELRDLGDNLETRVRERTEELALANAALVMGNTMRAEAEEKYHLIFENAAEGIYQSTPDGEFLAINPAAARIFGFSKPAQLLGKRDHAGYGYVDPNRVGEFLRLIGEAGFVNGFESEIFRRDGSRAWVSENVRAVHRNDGSIQYFEGTMVDITDRKESAETLRDSEEKFRQLADNVADVFYIASPDLREMHYVSSAYETVWGQPVESLYANPLQFSEAILPDERPGVMAAFARLGTDTASASRMFRIARPDGAIRWIFSRAFQIKDATGRVIRITGTATDITEHKRAEEAIKEGELRYRKLFEANPLPMWVYDLETLSFLEVNDAAISHYGFEREEFLAMTIADIRSQAEKMRLLGTTPQPPERGVSNSGIWQHRKKNGVIIDVDVTSHALDYKGRNAQLVLALDITDRKRTEEAIKETLRRLNDAQRIGQMGDWEWNMSTEAITWSPQVFEIFGRDPQLGPPGSYENYLALFDAENGALINETIAGAIQSGETRSHQVVMRHPSGSWIDLEGMVVPRNSEDGTLLGLFGTVQDITARKQAEEKSRKSEASLGNAQRIAHLGSWECDIPTGAIHWSDEVYRIFGLSPETFAPTNDTFFETIHPADRDAVRSASDTALAGGAPYSIDHRIIHADGTDRFVHEEAEITFGASGEAIRMAGTVQDITDRRRAEDALRTSKERLRAALSASCTGTFRWDIRRDQLDWDDSLDALFGLPPGETVRSLETFLAAVHPADRPGVIEGCERCAREGADFSMEFRVLWPDGSLHWLDDKGKTVCDAAGQPLYMTGACVDITERKRAEEALRVSEHRYHSLFENMLEGYAYCRTHFEQDELRDFTYLEVNGAFEKLTGLKNAVGRKVSELIPGIQETNRAIFDVYSRVARTGQPEKFETHVGSLDIWLSITVYSSERESFVAVFDNITERKRAATLLVESEQRLTLAKESAHIGIWDWDLLTNQLVWDDQMYALYGIREQDFSGAYDAWQRGLHPEDRERAEADIEIAVHGPDGFHIEFRVLWPNGEVRHIEAHAMVERAADGSSAHMIGVNWDITERKRTEEALQESETEFRTLAEAMPQLVWITRADGWCIYFNQHWMDYTGLTLAESIGTNWINAVHPDDRERTVEAWQHATATVGIYSVEYRLHHADGSCRWWLARGVPQLDPSGNVLKWFGTCTDIHDLKMSDAALRESSEKFQQLTDNIVDVFWIRSPDAKEVHYISPAFETIWGRTVESLYANPRDWSDFILPEDRAIVLAAYAELAKDSSSIDLEYRIMRPDGEIRWVHVRGSQVRDDAGALIRLTGIVTDITARKRAGDELVESRAALQQLNTDLEFRVAERTTALLQATEEADRANRAKSEFLSRTSHELRTPLNAILGFGQLLELEENFGPEPRESVEQILNAGRHLLTLIDEVLDISSAESGGIVLSPEPLEVEQVLNEVTSLVRPLCSSLQVRLDPPKFLEGDWFVLADPQRLRQVLLNVLGNAIKYNRPGGRVKVECALVENAEPPAFRFCVKDTGPGISAENLARLWTPFDRLDANRKQPHIIGTGLGLSLSKRLIELMGGVLGVESVVGEGSTFWIDVPLFRNSVALV